MDRDLLASARSGKHRSSQKFLIKYLEGGKLTRTQALKAKCYDCDCMGESAECVLEECPLLPYSPFKL